jgi:hypothetical protein
MNTGSLFSSPRAAGSDVSAPPISMGAAPSILRVTGEEPRARERMDGVANWKAGTPVLLMSRIGNSPLGAAWRVGKVVYKIDS